MNDFTKEELEIMAAIIVAAEIRCGDMSEPGKNVKQKIQSIIDNYCEHESDVWPLYTKTGDLPCAGLCFTCNTCVDRIFINDNS